MAQSTTNLGKIHVFPSETLYNQFKDIIADNDLALLKDDGAYIVAALLEQNGYVKFSNGLILQWGYNTQSEDYNVKVALPIAYAIKHYIVVSNAEDEYAGNVYVTGSYKLTLTNFMLSKTKSTKPVFWISLGI